MVNALSLLLPLDLTTADTGVGARQAEA